MNKLIIGEIALIIVFYLLYWQADFRAFFMETNLGHLLMVLFFAICYYLDKYLGVLFCFMIVFVHYTNPKENFFFYSQYDDEGESPNMHSAELNFRTNNCVHDELMRKGHKVKNEMVQHVFPEIYFRNDPCNPCDKYCKFDIVEEESAQGEEQINVSTLT